MKAAAIIEFDVETGKREIAAAWDAYQKTEPLGLKFGEVCYEWEQKLGKSKGGYGSKGKGLSGILTVLNIPRHTFDYWKLEHQYSVGLRQRPIPPGIQMMKRQKKPKEWTPVEHEAASHDLLRNEVRAYCAKMRKDPEYKTKLETFFREITEGLGVVVEVHVGS